MEDRCTIDLTRCDSYSTEELMPDAEVETCLKILRSMRNWALQPGRLFDAEAAVVLSHAHAWIAAQVQEVIDFEREKDRAAT